MQGSTITERLLLFEVFSFIYFEHCWCILCLLLLSIYKHVPICFFILFLDAPMLRERGDQILLSLENLALAHFIWSIIRLAFHFPIWLLLLGKVPVCTRLCWPKLLLHHQSVYRILCIQRDACNAAKHIFLLKSKSQSVKAWMSICHSLKPFPRNRLSFHPWIWIPHSLRPASSSAWQTAKTPSTGWYQVMLHQKKSKPHLTMHRGIWRLSRRLTIHSS